MSFRSPRLDVVGVTVELSATLRISALHILTALVLLGVLLPVCRGVRPPAYSVRITTIDTLATAAHLVLSPSQSTGTHRMRDDGTGRRVAPLLLSSGGALAINTRPWARRPQWNSIAAERMRAGMTAGQSR